MTLREKVKLYEDLLHRLHSFRAISMNHDAAVILLDRISDWSYAHRMGNGEFSASQQSKLVLDAAKRFGDPV